MKGLKRQASGKFAPRDGDEDEAEAAPPPQEEKIVSSAERARRAGEQDIRAFPRYVLLPIISLLHVCDLAGRLEGRGLYAIKSCALLLHMQAPLYLTDNKSVCVGRVRATFHVLIRCSLF